MKDEDDHEEIEHKEEATRLGFGGEDEAKQHLQVSETQDCKKE